MPLTSEERLAEVLTFLVTFGAVGLVLGLLVAGLARSREGLSIGLPIGVALVVRVLTAAAVSLTAFGDTLRGGDELSFLRRADLVSDSTVGSDAWTSALTNELHVFVLAVQERLLESPEMALRVTEAGIAVAGLVLLAVAVYEMAGPRAATVAAWVLALEPASVFFSTLLHKESIIVLAIGLVAFGGARLWRRNDLMALLPMAAGCALAGATRGYVSWFLLAAAAAITLHAGLRNARKGAGRSVMLVALVVLLAALTLPIVFGDFADENLRKLQVSQEANAADESNLQLERVDFSTGTGIITNLPTRIRDVVLRPYPWELDNTSQQLGLVGTLFVLAGLYLLARELIRNRGRIMARAGPFIYIALSLLIVYSLAAGNAGTGFRYRSQIVAVGICAVTALALWARARQPLTRAEPVVVRREGLPA